MAPRFKLESVLQHRQHLEDLAHQEFSDASRRWKEARQILDGMRSNRFRHESELKSKMKINVTADDLQRYHRYLGRLDREIAAQMALVENLAAKREAKREQLKASLQNRKVIGKLKERFLERTTRQGLAQEQKILDEVALHRFQGES